MSIQTSYLKLPACSSRSETNLLFEACRSARRKYPKRCPLFSACMTYHACMQHCHQSVTKPMCPEAAVTADLHPLMQAPNLACKYAQRLGQFLGQLLGQHKQACQQLARKLRTHASRQMVLPCKCVHSSLGTSLSLPKNSSTYKNKALAKEGSQAGCAYRKQQHRQELALKGRHVLQVIPPGTHGRQKHTDMHGIMPLRHFWRAAVIIWELRHSSCLEHFQLLLCLQVPCMCSGTARQRSLGTRHKCSWIHGLFQVCTL